ncbi:MAG: M14 family metallopeptidase [Defluviitaleaceae bacterium]|nr:M14 family metallopeptidase [Defluviitaleaceae bacterium]
MNLKSLFTAKGMFKGIDASKQNQDMILNGNIFIRPNCTGVEKEIAVNLCARIGIEVLGFDLPIVKIYSNENQLTYPVNIFINCGPFFKSEPGAEILVDSTKGKTYITLCGIDIEALTRKGKELYGLAEAKSQPSKNNIPNPEIIKSKDLSDIMSIKGMFDDNDYDFQADDFTGKIIIEDDCSDENLINYAHIAAKIASQTISIALPIAVLASKARGLNSPTVELSKDGSIDLTKGNLKIDNEAVNYFTKTFPYFDKKQTFHIADATSWISNQVKKSLEHDEFTAFEIIENEFYSETNELINWVESEVLPSIKPGDNINITAAVSEPFDMRKELVQKIQKMLKTSAAKTIEVKIISAFKQGQSFILESVVPEIMMFKDEIAEFVIGFKPFQKSKDEPWDTVSGAAPNYGDYEKDKWFELPIRWLQELYPVDDMIAEKLGISRDLVKFEKLNFESEHTYEILIKDKSGNVLFSISYNIDAVEKHYLKDFPDLGFVHISQGFAQCERNGKVISRKIIKGDREAFWEKYQESLSKCQKYIIDQGKATADNQPFFKRLEVEVFASEPNEVLNIRQDLISSLDALHEDIYFAGLDYFRQFGKKETSEPFMEPGLILPLIHERKGKGISYRISYIDKPVTKYCFKFNLQKIELNGETPIALHYNITELDIPLIEIKAALEKNVNTIDFPFSGTLYFKSGNESISVQVSHTQAQIEEIDIKKALANIENHIISYEEYIQYVKQLRDHPLVNIVKVATSLEQRELYAFEFTSDIPADVVSQAKRVTSRPTFFISSRHHANEISSTNSAFRFIFNMLTDDKFREECLKNFNLVILPLENTDGAVLGYELQKEHPTWIFHPARFNSVGRDFYTDYFTDKESEAQGFTNVWRKWLPDFVTDDHGVPSHEWAQPFSGYVSPWFRGFWLPRSMFYCYCSYVEDPKYPHIKPLYEDIAKHVSKTMDNHDDIVEASLEWKDRHTKYAFNFMPNMYPQDYIGNWIIYLSSRQQSLSAPYPHLRYPWITTFCWITEVADETAQSNYLELCSNTHYAANMAIVDYLSQYQYDVVTEVSDEACVVRICKRRIRDRFN